MFVAVEEEGYATAREMQLKHNCTDAARLEALAQPGAAGGGHSELVLNEAQLSAISDIFHASECGNEGFDYNFEDSDGEELDRDELEDHIANMIRDHARDAAREMQLKHNCTDAARLAALAQPGAAGGHSELVLNEAQLSAIGDIFHASECGKEGFDYDFEDSDGEELDRDELEDHIANMIRDHARDAAQA
jgi:NAD(P)H-dependent FMN reductase